VVIGVLNSCEAMPRNSSRPRPLLGAREPNSLLVGPAAFGDVAGHLREAAEAPILVAQRGDDDARPERRAVLANADPLVLAPPLGSGDGELALGLARPDILFGVEPREVAAHDLLGAVPLDPFGPAIPRAHVAARVQHEDRVILHLIDEQPELVEVLDEPCRLLRPRAQPPLLLEELGPIERDRAGVGERDREGPVARDEPPRSREGQRQCADGPTIHDERDRGERAGALARRNLGDGRVALAQARRRREPDGAASPDHLRHRKRRRERDVGECA